MVSRTDLISRRVHAATLSYHFSSFSFAVFLVSFRREIPAAERRRLVKGFQLHRRISGRPGNRTVGNHVDIRIFDRSRIIGAAAEQAERARRERRQRKGSGGIALYENVESVDSYPGVARSLRQINSSLYAAGARELNRIEFGLRGIRDGNFPGERFICA